MSSPKEQDQRPPVINVPFQLANASGAAVSLCQKEEPASMVLLGGTLLSRPVVTNPSVHAASALLIAIAQVNQPEQPGRSASSSSSGGGGDDSDDMLCDEESSSSSSSSSIVEPFEDIQSNFNRCRVQLLALVRQIRKEFRACRNRFTAQTITMEMVRYYCNWPYFACLPEAKVLLEASTCSHVVEDHDKKGWCDVYPDSMVSTIRPIVGLSQFVYNKRRVDMLMAGDVAADSDVFEWFVESIPTAEVLCMIEQLLGIWMLPAPSHADPTKQVVRCMLAEFCKPSATSLEMYKSPDLLLLVVEYMVGVRLGENQSRDDAGTKRMCGAFTLRWPFEINIASFHAFASTRGAQCSFLPPVILPHPRKFLHGWYLYEVRVKDDPLIALGVQFPAFAPLFPVPYEMPDPLAMAEHPVLTHMARRQTQIRYIRSLGTQDNDELAKAGQSACILCEERRPRVVMQPCRHMNVCRTCAVRLVEMADVAMQPYAHCPTCRAECTDMTCVFL